MPSPSSGAAAFWYTSCPAIHRCTSLSLPHTVLGGPPRYAQAGQLLRLALLLLLFHLVGQLRQHTQKKA